VQNISSKPDSHKLQPISDESILAPKEEIRVLALTYKKFLLALGIFRDHIADTLTVGQLPIHEFHRFAQVMFGAHIQRLGAVSRDQNTISSFGASHFSSQYSANIVCKSSANNRIPSLVESHVSVGASRFSMPYLAQIGGTPSAPTRISSFSTRPVSSQWTTEIYYRSRANREISSVVDIQFARQYSSHICRVFHDLWTLLQKVIS